MSNISPTNHNPPLALPRYYLAITLYYLTGHVISSDIRKCDAAMHLSHFSGLDVGALQGSDGKLPYLPQRGGSSSTPLTVWEDAAIHRHRGSTPRRVWASHYISPSKLRTLFLSLSRNAFGVGRKWYIGRLLMLQKAHLVFEVSWGQKGTSAVRDWHNSLKHWHDD